MKKRIFWGMVILSFVWACGENDEEREAPGPEGDSEVEESEEEEVAGEVEGDVLGFPGAPAGRVVEGTEILPVEDEEDEEVERVEEMDGVIEGRDVRLGTWVDGTFRGLQDGDDLRWEEGPQGGFHVLTAVRILGAEVLEWTDAQWEFITHSYELRTPQGDVLGGINMRGFLRPIEGGLESERFALRLQRPHQPEEHVGPGYILRIRVGFPDGRVWTEEVEVNLSCCDRIQ